VYSGAAVVGGHGVGMRCRRISTKEVHFNIPQQKGPGVNRVREAGQPNLYVFLLMRHGGPLPIGWMLPIPVTMR